LSLADEDFDAPNQADCRHRDQPDGRAPSLLDQGKSRESDEAASSQFILRAALTGGKESASN